MQDVKRLISEVAAQNGIRVEPDDPLFALVTINTCAALIVKEGIVHLVIGDEKIRQAILIVVRHSDSHPLPRVSPDSRSSEMSRKVPSPLFRNNWLEVG